jgi:hypothetical protein
MADKIKKPSFLGSVMSGITGYFKGAVAGGAVGAIGGAIVGGAIALLTVGAAELVGAALLGALIGGGTLAAIGSVAGAMTGVIKHRETLPSANDVVNVAKVSFVQGVATGHSMSQAQALEENAGKWREKVAREREVVQSQQTQLH